MHLPPQERKPQYHLEQTMRNLVDFGSLNDPSEVERNSPASIPSFATTLAKAKAERLQREAERDAKAEREKVEREKAEREKVEREKAEREKAEREKAEREKVEAEEQLRQPPRVANPMTTEQFREHLMGEAERLTRKQEAVAAAAKKKKKES
jgi:hypothetical protein